VTPAPTGANGVLRVAAAQARPVWLDAGATTDRVEALIEEAAQAGVGLLAFPETFLPGYPVWVCRTDGARFEDPRQKRAFAQYLAAAVEIDGPEVARVCRAAARHGVFVYLGIAERCPAAGGGTVYCTLLAIDPEQGVVGAHRKLVPTHDERLVWGRGDGHGLRTHSVGGVRTGGLSCWENWMPQARHALYCEGEELHISTWPGAPAMTADAPRLVALEGRVYSLAASGLLSHEDIPEWFEFAREMRGEDAGFPFRGGSGIVGPDGRWVVGPVVGTEGLVIADIELDRVRQERLSFDVAGHYARPDVFEVTVHRRRLSAGTFTE